MIAKGRELGLDAHFVTRVFHEVIDDSVRSQQLMLLDQSKDEQKSLHRVAYQGLEGTYSHMAAKEFFSAQIDQCALSGYTTVEAAARALEAGDVDCAVLPVENTTVGNVTEVYDVLAQRSLSIVGEQVFRVQHCLLGVEQVAIEEIQSVWSHPLAINQCNRFLSTLNVRRGYLTDTASAARTIRERNDIHQAAIASEEAARAHGLKILKRDIADQKENYTRFLVVAQKPIEVDPRIASKTTMLFATAHQRGALLRVLEAFDEAEVNLSKLDSRPRPDVPFQYMFYLDFEGNLAEERVAAAIEKVRRATTFIKILGSYPMHHRKRTEPSLEAIVAPQAKPEPAEAPAAKQNGTAKAAGPAKAPKKKVSYKLASRQTKAEDTVLDIRGVKLGGPEFVTIAGPCSVESREQIMACARQVKEAGGQILRGGCFKPRTSPYSFQGLGYEGLELLAEAGRAYDLPIITEVLSPVDVQKVAETADILQIGARNMQNFSLLNEAGRVNRPVMLKRGMMATIDEFLNAAEYILQQGNHQVILCERGIRTFETSVRNTLDLASVPVLKGLTHLPVVVDPSHAAGKRDLVVPLALASHGVAPHGMMVEIHPEPEKALSDGPQALLFPTFAELMQTIHGN